MPGASPHSPPREPPSPSWAREARELTSLVVWYWAAGRAVGVDISRGIVRLQGAHDQRAGIKFAEGLLHSSKDLGGSKF